VLDEKAITPVVTKGGYCSGRTVGGHHVSRHENLGRFKSVMLTAERLSDEREINASESKLCFWRGKTLVYFYGGNQHGVGICSQPSSTGRRGNCSRTVSNERNTPNLAAAGRGKGTVTVGSPSFLFRKDRRSTV